MTHDYDYDYDRSWCAIKPRIVGAGKPGVIGIGAGKPGVIGIGAGKPGVIGADKPWAIIAEKGVIGADADALNASSGVGGTGTPLKLWEVAGKAGNGVCPKTCGLLKAAGKLLPTDLGGISGVTGLALSMTGGRCGVAGIWAKCGVVGTGLSTTGKSASFKGLWLLLLPLDLDLESWLLRRDK
jgi:hypothetical protein